MSKATVLLIALVAIALAPVQARAGDQDNSSPARYFSAAPWQMKAMPGPISLYIMDRETFLAAAFVHGYGPNTGAFASWNNAGEINCKIYVTPDRVDLIFQEIRHCQDGHYHE